MRKVLSILLLIFVFSCVGFTADVELDYMEYDSDDSAQAAYVSSDIYSSDITPNMTSGTAPSPNVVTFSSSYGPGNPSYLGYKAFDGDVGTYWNMDSSSGTSAGQWIKFDFGSGNTHMVIKCRIYNQVNHGLNAFKIQGSNNDSDWTDIYSDNCVNAQGWNEFTFTNTTAYRYYKLLCVSGYNATNLAIFEVEYMTVGALQCYSSTTNTQGTYALECIAVKDDSLADTIYHAFSPVIDLTGKTQIKLDTRATITGQNYSVKIHDSGGTTTTHAVTIADTSAYQTDTWDISGVSNANKDAIDQILIEIDTADTPNTFYLDNIYAPEVEGGHPTTSQLLNGGLWYNSSLKHSDWCRFKRGTNE